MATLDTPQAEPHGRREAHKAATRKALQEAAHRLFEERGYAQTTVRDIAAAAGVTERTFFRYFPSKEDLVLDEVLDLIPVMRAQVLARPADEDPYASVLGACLELITDGAPSLLLSGPPQRFPGRPVRQFLPVLSQFEDGLTEALRERLAEHDPEAATPLRAAVLARASVGAMRSALFAYAALPEEERTTPTAHELLTSAFEYLRKP
ncbi:TetR/AcrR family transcriptional regulator [Streptomyces cinnabarinus]|uniref:TetR/AcrR family transcriptional regulator n=1 Tax=Streptomyces cinnabarinus TaxID=67287 RepID=A0ABY7KEC5_9ACTN|nr:TetR family transcriptional regulator [Streptomyces cinnabarinus]WAZ21502.1 TetR/AcrR family transcriptional regulator [Streptomyces cinnabarinus]